MSKLKLLLLGGIFTLFGIFNFSSANTYTLSSDGNGYIPSSINIIEPIDKIVLKDYSCPDGKCSLTLRGIIPNQGSVQCRFQLSNGTMYGPKGDYCDSSSWNCYYQCDFGGFVGIVQFEFTSSVGPFDFFTFSDGVSSDLVFDMYNNGLTPAVEGVKTTVNQIIPLMVFIGIGVLFVTLGFIAIRWLVNWLGGKIKSIFKSKRG